MEYAKLEYAKIVAVSGLPGLFELISSKSDGAVERSLDEKTTSFISSRIHNFSQLESIEVFTSGDNVNLVEIFNAMGESDVKMPDEKDAAAVKKYFEKVYPDLDFERVYNSDLKKMVRWFAILKDHKIEIKLSEPEEEPAEEEVEMAEETSSKEKLTAKSAKKPSKAKDADDTKEKKSKSSRSGTAKNREPKRNNYLQPG